MKKVDVRCSSCSWTGKMSRSSLRVDAGGQYKPACCPRCSKKVVLAVTEAPPPPNPFLKRTDLDLVEIQVRLVNELKHMCRAAGDRHRDEMERRYVDRVPPPSQRLNRDTDTIFDGLSFSMDLVRRAVTARGNHRTTLRCWAVFLHLPDDLLYAEKAKTEEDLARRHRCAICNALGLGLDDFKLLEQVRLG